MNTEALFLFLILLLGLVLYSFLGGNYNENDSTNNYESNDENDATSENSDDNDSYSSIKLTNGYSFYENYDNYNHYSGSSSALPNGATYYEKNGGSVKVDLQSDGIPQLIVSLTQGAKPIKFVSDNSDPKSGNLKFNGPKGETALVINYEGNEAIEITTTKGSYVYTITNPPPAAKKQPAKKPQQPAKKPQQPAKKPQQPAKKPQQPTSKPQQPTSKPQGNKQPSQSTQNQNALPPSSMLYYLFYQQPASGQFNQPPISSNQIVLNPFNPNYSSYNNTPSTYFGSTGVKGGDINYSNLAAEGIPKSQIPPGYEDLYILKSAIVPPVCPVCPASSACPREEKCPPCPACARCPEPSFECKKVPNYNSVSNNNNNNFLPFANYNSVNNNNNNNFSPFHNFNSLNNDNNDNGNKTLPVPVLNDFSSFGM